RRRAPASTPAAIRRVRIDHRPVRRTRHQTNTTRAPRRKRRGKHKTPKGAGMTVTSDQVQDRSQTTAPEPLTQEQTIDSLGTYEFGWHDSDDAGASAER